MRSRWRRRIWPRSVAFYERLGFHLLYGGRGSPFSTFRAGGGYLNLQADEAWMPTEATWGRVIFHVDDVDAMYERTLTAGFTPSAPPADAPWRERFFHIRDPDGHELSFARPLAEGSGDQWQGRLPVGRADPCVGGATGVCGQGESWA